MKKKFIVSVLLVLLTGTFALAEWLVEFRDIYLEDGIEPAVIEALKQGATPEGIMENGLLMEDLNPQNLVKAMYCGGIKGDDIRAAGQRFDVSDQLIVAGYKKSVEECGDEIVDTQAYTPAAVAVSFVGPAAPGGGTSASPASF